MDITSLKLCLPVKYAAIKLLLVLDLHNMGTPPLFGLIGKNYITVVGKNTPNIDWPSKTMISKSIVFSRQYRKKLNPKLRKENC